MRGYFGLRHIRPALTTLLAVVAFSTQAFSQTKIMPLGNSITWGNQGQSQASDTGYRDDLYNLLTAAGVSFDFVGSQQSGVFADPDHEGWPGYRADQILANINTYLTAASPNVIILHIGTNDVSNDQTAPSTRIEIEGIIDAIHNFSPSIKIILSSLIPRNDNGVSKEPQNTELNTLIEDLFYTKRSEGKNLYYAGANEIFKQNPAWVADYLFDEVHPTDAGYALMAGVYFNAIMIALNSNTTDITDNFERTALGATWNADPEFLLQGGRLVNSATTAPDNAWHYMATYKGVRNPTRVGIRWAADADAAGIHEGGLALLLNSASKDADGYLAWITTSDNVLRLWTIQNGRSSNDLDAEVASSLPSPPGPGDLFEVEITVDGSNLRFDYYVNDQLAGTTTTPNPGGLGTELYSGVLLKHNLNNNIEDFYVEKTSDTSPPSSVDDLAVVQSTASSVQLTWRARGDDGDEGQATSYDLRYSTQVINSGNFANATQYTAVPNPSAQNSIENVTVSGLAAGTQYFFAIKVLDEAGNASGLSNVVSASTEAGNFFSDDFNRASLGDNWSSAAGYATVNNELSNTSSSANWNEIAVLNARKNPTEVSFRYSDVADAAGIDQSGFVVVSGGASATGSGYAITRRTGSNNQIRLWNMVNGGLQATIVTNSSPNLSPPGPGDVVRIAISTSGSSNRFDFYKNDVYDGTVEDTGFLYDLNSDYWTGVTLRALYNNSIDDFSVLLEVGAAANMMLATGDAQIDTVGQTLPIPLTVRVTDEAGSPVGGVNVNFEVTGGGGSVDVAPPRPEIVIEAESGTLTAPMTISTDGSASGGGYIEVPDGTGGGQNGLASFTINITDPGAYIMWGRGIYPDPNADVFFVSIDGTEYFWDMGQRVAQSDWYWDELSHRGNGTSSNPEIDPAVFTLNAGLHTIQFREGKDGAKLDQFVLVKQNSGYQTPPNQGIAIPGGTFTNSGGEASTRLTLGQVPGLNTVRAYASGLPDVTFTATGAAGTVAAINKVSGDGQTADPGQALSLPFVVEVYDEFGNLAIGATTTWTLLDNANGSLSQGGQVIVNNSGQASNTLTLSTNTGLNRVQVTAPGYSGEPVIFIATATAGNAASISLDSGNNQNGTASTPLPQPFRVLVADNIGSPVPGYSVLFRVIAGGGNFAGNTEQTVVSGADGIAEATLTLGPTPGAANQAQVIADGLTGSPVTFSASSSEPQSMQAISSLVQSGIASVPLSDSIQVLIKDVSGNPLPAFPVEFTVTLGDGRANESTSPVTVTTNGQGIAMVQWRLGPNEGTANNKLRAAATFNSKNLSGSPIEFTASAIVGDAANLIEVSGNNGSGQVLTALDAPFKVRVTDDGNNPVMGWPVEFRVIEGGGHLNGQPVIIRSTNELGEAEATLTLGSTAGTPENPFNNKVRVSAENLGMPLQGSPIGFEASAIATGARELVLVAGGGQTGNAGDALPQQIQVMVTDGPNQNPIAGHPVSFEIITGGGTLNGDQNAQVEVQTNNSGIAAVDWYLGGALGTNSQSLRVTATDGITNLTNSPLTLQASAIAGSVDPDASVVISDVSAVQADGQSAAKITIRLTDPFGNAIPNKAVIITSSGSNNAITQPTGLTNAQGEAYGMISSTRAEVKRVSARNITDGLDLNTFVNITFLSQPPERVEMSNGNNQTTNVSTAVQEPIEVYITDRYNNPVPGVQVRFEVTAGGGYIAETSNPGSGSASVMATEETTTNGQGRAAATWVLGTVTGTNTALARAYFDGNELAGSPITFSAQAVAGVATNLSTFSGTNQQGQAGLALKQLVQILVSDDAGRPVSGVPVNFSVTAGGGSVIVPNPVTDFRGLASTRVLLGKRAGTNVIEVQNNSLSGSPIALTFEGLVGPPALILPGEGHDTSAPVNGMKNVSVWITDYFSNSVSGVPVNFQVVQGGGQIISQDQASGNDGIAIFNLQMPTTLGDTYIKATSSQLSGISTTLVVHAVAAEARNLLEYSGNNQDGTPGRPLVYPLVVQATDNFGNPVSGVEIQWVRTLGNGSVNPEVMLTNNEGLAWTERTLGDLGNNETLAIAGQLTPAQLTFTSTGVLNAFPEFTALTDQQVLEGNPLQFQLSATDLDDDPLSFEAQNLPNGATFSSGNRTFSWTPNQTQQGTYKVTFIVRDGRGGLDYETITISVINSNNPPVITSYTPLNVQDLRIRRGQVIRFSVAVSDADPGGQIFYTWDLLSANLPDGQKLLSTSPFFDFDSNNFEPGSYDFRVKVFDGEDADTLMWRGASVVIVSVELSSFTLQFNEFDGVQLNWSTAQEVGNAGFNILRSASKDGDYDNVNVDLIRPSEQAQGNYSFIDKTAEADRKYYYKLEDVNLDGIKSQHGPLEITITAPENFELGQNYPNPFNPTTNIRFKLPERGHVQLQIFDILGRQVRTLVDQELPADYHLFTWDARDNHGVPVSSGVYYYQIISGKNRGTKKMLLIK